MKIRTLFVLILALSVLTPAFAQEKIASKDVKTKKITPKKPKMMYTTYFYTATEAIVHGYERDTEVRIVSLKKGSTIWKGKVGPGETKVVKTGRGVFGFLSDKKASILVGTPTTCNVVGYWFRNQEGSFASKQFYGRLPSQSMGKDERVVIWAWDDVNIQVTDFGADKSIYKGKLKKGEFYQITGKRLSQLLGHTLDVRADKPKISVQVYFDEGFFLPSSDGRTAGKIFRGYVGKITEGKNDLNLISYHQKAKVTVRDKLTKKQIWKGTIQPGAVKTLTLAGQFVEVTSNVEISALVAPYEHYGHGYAEHHFGAGIEGTGIETDFYLTTPDELWVFSYFDNNDVEVIDAKTNKSVWKGSLNAGHVQGLTPGHGFYRVKSNAGISVMGGDQACGAEFSPAGGMFKVDEELLKVTEQIYAEREAAAHKKGKKLSKKEKYAPLSASENRRARDYVKQNMGKSMSAEEVDQRVESIQAAE